MNEFESVRGPRIAVVKRARRTAADRSIELRDRMSEVMDRALEISGLAAEYDALAAKVLDRSMVSR